MRSITCHASGSVFSLRHACGSSKLSCRPARDTTKIFSTGPQPGAVSDAPIEPKASVPVAAPATAPPAKPAAKVPAKAPTKTPTKVPAKPTSTAAKPLTRPKPPTKVPVALKPPNYVDPFLKVVEAEKAGLTVEVKVKALNKGGLVVMLGEMKGFLPFTQLAANTIKQGPEADYSYLVGTTLKAKVVSVETEGGRKDFVMSEKKAQQGEAMRSMKLGAIVKAVVRSVEDYGAFVEIVDLPGVSGLVHKSELSWDSVMTVDQVVQTGQIIEVKVIDLDVAKCRLGLSVRQTKPDPIRVTLDTVQWGPSKDLPVEMQQLMDRLKQQPGVEGVRVGRQATESKISSQDLVVYLTKEVPAADGFDIVARLGNVLQELYVVSKLSRDEARSLLAKAVK